MKLHSNMLSYARSIQTGEAVFYGRHAGAGPVIDGGRLNTEALTPALVDEISVRGQIGNYIADATSKEFNIDDPNLQTIDKAKLPARTDRLVIKFPVQFLPNAMRPHACDDAQVAKNLDEVARRYAERGGFDQLARRYLWNLVNGRWMWRNFIIAEDKRIHLLDHGETLTTVDPSGIRRDYYPGDAELREAVDGFDELARRIAGALSGEGDIVTLEVVGEGGLPELSEIFPSEEFLAGEAAQQVQSRRGSRSAPGKVLSSVRVADADGNQVRQPTFHPQKVGNALRCIDEWHGIEGYPAVAVDPYAAITTRAIALRPPREGSFYDFLTINKRRDAMLQTLENEDPGTDAFGNVHFVIANFVRGGVFGGKE
jgi:CRISPR-associated protein Csy3